MNAPATTHTRAVWHTDGGWACPDCHALMSNDGVEPVDAADTASGAHTFRVLWRCGGCGAEYGRLWGSNTDAPERVVGR